MTGLHRSGRAPGPQPRGSRGALTQLDREILRLAVPAFGALLAEPVFLLADSAIVGHLGTLPLAALGVAGTALTALVAVFIFLAYGTTAAVARRLGTGDQAGALRAGIDGMWLAGCLGVPVALLGALAAAPVVAAMGAPAAVVPYAATYLRISVLAAPAMLIVLAATGVLRGLQDTRTPLAVAVAGSLVNIGLNVALVYGAGLGIAGSALGTAATQTGMAAVYVALVVRAAGRFGVRLAPDARGVRESARSGAPLVVRTLSLRAAIVATTYVAARLGAVPLAAHQVAFAIWGLLAFAVDAIAIAGQALVGHHLGAGSQPRARATTLRMLQWGLAAGLVLGGLTAAGRWLYVPLFTPDTPVQSAAAAALLVVAGMQPLAAVVLVLDGVLIGAGEGGYLAWAGLVTLLGYLPLLVLVRMAGGGLVALWWAFTGFMALRALTLAWRVRGDRWLRVGALR